MKRNGYSSIEIMVVLLVIGVLALAMIAVMTMMLQRRTAAQVADLWAMETIAEQAFEQTRPHSPTWQEVQQIAGGRWKAEYHYIIVEHPHSRTPGVAVDLCGEGSPLSETDCQAVRWVIVSESDPGGAADYAFAVSMTGVYAVRPADEDTVRHNRPHAGAPHQQRDVTWWEGEDPGLQRWIRQ
jgi:Tfp pilus assembly protein PilE